MATSFLKSFMEAVNPAVGKAAKKTWDPQGHKTERRMRSEAASNALLAELSSKEALEARSIQPEIIVVSQAVQEPLVDDENVPEVSGEEIPPMELADQIVVHRWIPVEDPEEMDSTDLNPVLTSINDGDSEDGDIIQDAKFFQEAATEYQLAYQSLDEKYTHQATLVKEASEALKASESRVAELQEEVMTLKQTRETDIQQAVGQAVSQYEQRLSTEQSRTQEHQSAIVELQGQVQALQVSLASQRDLPSVGVTQEGVNLRDEVFNYVPGTINTNWGAAVYQSPDQAFLFQKYIRFGDRSKQPDLELDVAGSGAPTSPPPQLPPHSSTPFHGVSQVPLNRTFDISGIPPTNLGSAQDVATIAAEVLAAVAAQASKEFRQMWEPKITKLHGGYSADAELVFQSWWADILANIQDRELDNKAAIQLIKEQTLDNARRKVEFQLDLCGGEITYQNLLRHLSIAFQGGNDEANILAEFYSHGQKLKESEEAFADELQILARKVIIKKPDFRVNLDTTLKQHYASQLFDHNSMSIAKTLLIQMQQCSFMEFRNELAQVLDTCQHAISKASAKPIMTKSVEVEEEEEDAPLPPQPSKSHAKKDKKISAQSSQIKDLRSKLDQAVAENSQIRELLLPATLTTAFLNALKATKTSFASKSKYRGNNQQSGQGRPFLGKHRPSQLSVGKDGVTNPNQTCCYYKDMGHLLENCVRLEARQQFLANCEKREEGLN